MRSRAVVVRAAVLVAVLVLAGCSSAGADRPGYSVAADTARLTAGEFAFRVLDPEGDPVTRFAVEHDKRMHLIVVRRDGEHYQHVHPELTADGTWRVPLTLPAPGEYRAFADFRPEGAGKQVLGMDLAAPGDYRPTPPGPQLRVATVDGYTVRLDGDLAGGASSVVTATVSLGGAPVTDLEPYLAAYGHLVALRTADLAYLHVHPDGAPGDGRTAAGPEIVFAVEAPGGGRHRLYLDFRHRGVVRTATFDVDVAGSATPSGGGHGGHGGHG